MSMSVASWSSEFTTSSLMDRLGGLKMEYGRECIFFRRSDAESVQLNHCLFRIQKQRGQKPKYPSLSHSHLPTRKYVSNGWPEDAAILFVYISALFHTLSSRISRENHCCWSRKAGRARPGRRTVSTSVLVSVSLRLGGGDTASSTACILGLFVRAPSSGVPSLGRFAPRPLLISTTGFSRGFVAGAADAVASLGRRVTRRFDGSATRTDLTVVRVCLKTRGARHEAFCATFSETSSLRSLVVIYS